MWSISKSATNWILFLGHWFSRQTETLQRRTGQLIITFTVKLQMPRRFPSDHAPYHSSTPRPTHSEMMRAHRRGHTDTVKQPLPRQNTDQMVLISGAHMHKPDDNFTSFCAFKGSISERKGVPITLQGDKWWRIYMVNHRPKEIRGGEALISSLRQLSCCQDLAMADLKLTDGSYISWVLSIPLQNFFSNHCFWKRIMLGSLYFW